MEKVPNLPMRKPEPPEEVFKSGRSLGRYEIEKIIDEDLETLKKRSCSNNIRCCLDFGIGVLETLKSQIVQEKKDG